MSEELFLEIGTEEIPSGFLPRALEDLKGHAEEFLEKDRITFGEAKTLGTPRRLVLWVTDVAEAQAPFKEEVVGPARRAAYSDQGEPTQAAIGFAKSQGVPVESLSVVQTSRGEYVQAVREEPGKPAEEVLQGLLPELISNLSFPKSMRWGAGDLRFARPIHWVVALLGGSLLSFELDGVKSGSASRGHRFMSPGPFPVEDFRQYLQAARERFVIVDPQERLKLLEAGARAAAKTVGGEVLHDEELLQEVTHLLEFPTAVLGDIESRYLALPREVLITAMRRHQRFFSVKDAKGELLPHFIAFSNTEPEDLSIIRQGNERVLRARLSDAEFFFREDAKKPLETFVESLKGVIFQNSLGTSYEKVERIVHLAQYLAGRLEPELEEVTCRAAYLCKADLETQMVYEFPELQGHMGREYARLQKEPVVVCQAISDHYSPRSAKDPYPPKGPGALVGIADKLDTLTGYVGLGQTPSGSQDPYGLRRAARGVLGTLIAHGYRLSLQDLIRESAHLLSDRVGESEEDLFQEVLAFFRGRLANLWVGEEHRADLVEAVLSAGCEDVVNVGKRLEALERVAEAEDFEALTTTFKRVANIITQAREKGIVPPSDQRPKGGGRKAAPGKTDAEKLFSVDPALLEEPAEKALFETYQSKAEEFDAWSKAEDYLAGLTATAGLRSTVDHFFDNVLVMCDDETLRKNRLALLASIGGLFEPVADFRKVLVKTPSERKKS